MSLSLSTEKAARVVGINQRTLQRWMRAGRVKAPKPRLRNGQGIRLWSKADIEQLRKVKERTYRKGRGRKKKKA